MLVSGLFAKSLILFSSLLGTGQESVFVEFCFNKRMNPLGPLFRLTRFVSGKRNANPRSNNPTSNSNPNTNRSATWSSTDNLQPATGNSLPADPKLYDRDPARVATLGKERADAASALASAEDQWLALSGEYEDAVGA